MSISGSSNSATNEYINVKNIDKWEIQLSDLVENIV